jgi:hypothetical protein
MRRFIRGSLLLVGFAVGCARHDTSEELSKIRNVDRLRREATVDCHGLIAASSVVSGRQLTFSVMFS